MSEYEIKPYTNHYDSPSITFYMINDGKKNMGKFSCVWCKRTLAQVKGAPLTVTMTPMSVEEFGMAYNIRCKLCKQDYRFVTNPHIVVVEAVVEIQVGQRYNTISRTSHV